MRIRLAICVAGLLWFGTRPGAAQGGSPVPVPPPVDVAKPSAAGYTESVEITTTRVEDSLLDAPVSVTIVDSAQIETTPATNMGDLLRGVPGLNVIQTSARDVNVRTRGAVGVAENSQLVLLDGRSIYLDYYGIVVWDYMPVDFDEIQRIEVQQGPGSAVWGANALSGVINVITKSPREIQGGLATLAVGERGYREASARWAGAAGPWSYRASASYQKQDPWTRVDSLPNGDPLPLGFSFKDRGTEQPKLDLRADWEPDASSRWSYRLGYGGTTGIFHSNIGPFLIEKGAYVGYGEAEYTSGLLDGRVYWNRLRGDAPALLSGLPFHFAMDAYVGEGTQRRAIGDRQLLVYGGDLRLDRFDLSLAPLDHSRRAAGVFLEDQLRVNPHLELSLGARFDYFNTIHGVVSPRASLVWQPSPDQALRLGYNRAYRAPSLVENFLQVAVPTALDLGPTLPPFVYFIDAVGNPGLKEEKIDAVELGYSHAIGKHAGLSATIYRNEVSDHILFFPTAFYGPDEPPPGWPLPASFVPPFVLPKSLSFINVGKVRDQGVELSGYLDWSPGVRTRFSYTYQDEPRVSDQRGIPLTVNRPPKQMASLGVTALRGPWMGSLAANEVGSAFWADVLDSRFWGTTKSYLLVDLSFGRKIMGDRLECIVSATDLLDRKIQQHIYGDIIGRKAAIELRVHF